MFDNVSLSPEFIATLVVLGLIAAGFEGWKHWDRRKFEAVLRKFTPDEIEPYVIRAYDMATKAVDQIVAAGEKMTSAEKFALAQRIALALLKFFLTGKMTADAQRGLVEYQMYERNRAKRAQEALPLGG